jgi:Flp pilus assembly protein TadG
MRRLNRFSPVRFRDEERGAVLAIVAISLICLLGMLVLTFDLGRGVALKRNMVNAADSGALAAARECGLAHGEGEARTAAEDLVADNNSAATVTGFEIDQVPQCSGVASDGERQVTVTVTVPQEYFFAQIFGFNSGTVTASATAEWTLGATNPAPLKIDQLKIEQCVEEGEPDSEGRVDCYFTFEKGPSPLNSDWGWLNLPEGWPVKDQDPNPPNCSSQKGGSRDLGDYIGGMGGMGTPGDETLLPGLWDPTGAGNPPTWVCSSTGHKAVNVEDLNDWVDSVQKLIAEKKLESEPVVLFPVVACDPAKTPGDPDCREWKYTPGVAYPVVKLQGFFVKEAWDGQQARRQPNCHFTRHSSDVFCIHLQTTGSDAPTTGGSVKVWLVD